MKRIALLILIGIKDNLFTSQWTGAPVTLAEIREDADNCPVCMLAIIRQSGLNCTPVGMEFNFRAERDEWWKEESSMPQWGYWDSLR